MFNILKGYKLYLESPESITDHKNGGFGFVVQTELDASRCLHADVIVTDETVWINNSLARTLVGDLRGYPALKWGLHPCKMYDLRRLYYEAERMADYPRQSGRERNVAKRNWEFVKWLIKSTPNFKPIHQPEVETKVVIVQ